MREYKIARCPRTYRFEADAFKPALLNADDTSLKKTAFEPMAIPKGLNPTNEGATKKSEI